MISSVLYGLAAVGLVICYLSVPPGKTDRQANLQSVFRSPKDYVRWSPSNLVREIDQLKLGSLIVPHFDPLINYQKGKRLKNLFLDVYREMQADSDFVGIGSVMHHVYSEMFGFPFDNRHLYTYIPNKTSSNNLPVILFLHGSLGNFKAYLWVWKKFADTHQVAIVVPSFGVGLWYKDGAMTAVEEAREFIVNHPRLDRERIVLAGLSNGGIGVSRVARKHAKDYQGLIYISPVMERSILTSEEFISSWKERPIYILHGSKDARLSKPFINKTISDLNQNGITPEVKFYENEDHFLFLSKRTELMNDISEWAKKYSLL